MSVCQWRTWSSCFPNNFDPETFRGRIAGDGAGGFSPRLSLKWPDRTVLAVQLLQLWHLNDER